LKLIRITNQGRGAKFLLPAVAFVFLFAGSLSQVRAAALQTGVAQQTSSGSEGPGFGRQLVQESREAAGEDNEESQFKHSPAVQLIAKVTGMSLQHAYWLCILLNFGIVAALIIWVSKKYLPAAFRNRTAAIQRAMEEARRASEDANRRLADIEQRLSRLDAEIGGIRAQAEKEAAAEEEKIKAAAAEDARKIVESAEQEITAATKAARRDLTKYAADLAVSLARHQIHVDSATDQALVRNFAQQLSANGEATRKGGQ
jgi:F-type H+-transporting ATPase subunit b